MIKATTTKLHYGSRLLHQLNFLMCEWMKQQQVLKSRRQKCTKANSLNTGSAFTQQGQLRTVGDSQGQQGQLKSAGDGQGQLGTS